MRRVESSSSIIFPMVVFTVSIGMTKPIPSTLVADFLEFTMPMSCPSALKHPPPELPGLMAAVTCIRCMTVPSKVMSLARALTMPLVTEFARVPKGFPMTMAVSPTRTSLPFP